MNFKRLFTAITLYLITSADNSENEDDAPRAIPPVISNNNVPDETPEDHNIRRKRCPGCKGDTSPGFHEFGLPSKYCNGPLAVTQDAVCRDSTNTGTPSSLSSHVPSSSFVTSAIMNPPPHVLRDVPANSKANEFRALEAHNQNLRKQLEELELEEKLTKAREEERELMEKIAARRSTPSAHASQMPSAVNNIHHAPRLSDFVVASEPMAFGNRSAFPSAEPNISHLLNPTPSVIPGRMPSHQQQQPSLLETFRQQELRCAEVYLRPTTTLDNGQGKPLRVVDFVSRTRPTEEETVISSDSGSQTKLLLSIGNKKPKLENVTIEEFNIANIRIFYSLLTSGKLPTAGDVRDYLSYSVKLLQLARNHTWESVLKYDDEYRVIQHTYGYPWSFDHSHLHEVILVQRAALFGTDRKGVNTRPQPAARRSVPSPSNNVFGTHNSLGQEHCRNFNRIRGCQKSDCKFLHTCNRKLANQQTCGQAHPGCLHDQPSQ